MWEEVTGLARPWGYLDKGGNRGKNEVEDLGRGGL